MTTFIVLAAILHTFTLTWQDNSNNEEGFYIYRDNLRVGEVIADVTTFEHVVNGFVGQQVCYKVRAFNHQFSDGTGFIQESEPSNIACGVIPPQTEGIPADPTNLVVQP